ncbi:histidinol-phosphatase HisJ family protein [Wansuia hejianensis]|uniref:Histidinol-phosphatase n=1 Tax=Wansuia hejianensis TaxID=2763667 RepID=A0A926IGF8_9FIRM|nr:histidinol-phosphatase HisJ family protein [Wansuia hejianensis]MBC8589542.1 histidinol-phosphatase HisJ family protein [Wansuia hejianensis]
MYDFHLHSNFSMDSQANMEDMVLSAINKDLKSICFTDHVDLESTSQLIDFQFIPEDYIKEIKKVKYRYMKEIEILCGVEIGMQPHLKIRYEEFIKNTPLDFVILSIHSINGRDIVIDEVFGDTEPFKALEEYYENMYESIKTFDNYDVLGHMDFIDRYIENKSLLPNYNNFYDIIIEILKLVIHNGKGIELNTAGLRHGLSYFNPKPDILRLYKNLGGEIITIGSDAHTPEFVGYKYREAERYLRDLGFKYIYLFKDRKKFPINIR